MKRSLLIFLVTLFITVCSLSAQPTNPADQKQGTYHQISMDEAVEIINTQTGYIILDVRRADEFAAGHIPGAINIPNESIDTGEIPQLPDKNQLILVYCRSGRRSKEVRQLTTATADGTIAATAACEYLERI